MIFVFEKQFHIEQSNIFADIGIVNLPSFRRNNYCRYIPFFRRILLLCIIISLVSFIAIYCILKLKLYEFINFMFYRSIRLSWNQLNILKCFALFFFFNSV